MASMAIAMDVNGLHRWVNGGRGIHGEQGSDKVDNGGREGQGERRHPSLSTRQGCHLASTKGGERGRDDIAAWCGQGGIPRLTALWGGREDSTAAAASEESKLDVEDK